MNNTLSLLLPAPPLTDEEREAILRRARQADASRRIEGNTLLYGADAIADRRRLLQELARILSEVNQAVHELQQAA